MKLSKPESFSGCFFAFFSKQYDFSNFLFLSTATNSFSFKHGTIILSSYYSSILWAPRKKEKLLDFNSNAEINALKMKKISFCICLCHSSLALLPAPPRQTTSSGYLSPGQNFFHLHSPIDTSPTALVCIFFSTLGRSYANFLSFFCICLQYV